MIVFKNSKNKSVALLNQNTQLGITFEGNYLRQAKISYPHSSVINVYIFYKLEDRENDNAEFTIENGLFGNLTIVKDVNTSHYKYSGYGLCFHIGDTFSFGDSINAKNTIIFGGCDMSSSTHPSNQSNFVHNLGKSLLQGINGTTSYAEKLYKTNFTEQDKKFVLSLHGNGDNSYLFANGVQQLKFKTKTVK